VWFNNEDLFKSLTMPSGIVAELNVLKDMEEDCPDDEDYECYKCGGETGRGYDNGLCCECLGE
jgi:hypothetical protein